MTTIAYKDGVMAGDSLASYDGSFGGRVQKVFRSKNGDLVGACGDIFVLADIREWVEKRHCRGALPDGGDGCSIIWVKPDGTMRIVEHGRAVQMEGPFAAIGSGSDIAKGAMAAGASAMTAVEIACTLSNTSSGPVMSVAIDTSALVNDASS